MQFFRPQGSNPFAINTIKPTQPLVDKEEKNTVLKLGLTPDLVPEELDAIIIGSGIGSLSCANLLARAGKKCLVLEQHDRAGGCTHTHGGKKKGYDFDIGIHYIGEMKENSASNVMIKLLTDGQLKWVNLDIDADLVALGPADNGNTYVNPSGKQRWREKMLEAFPNEEKAIDAYLAKLQAIRRNILGLLMLKLSNKWISWFLVKSGLVHYVTKFFKYAEKTTKEVIDEITDNADLRAMLCYSFGDYGTIPSESSFVTHALLMNHYLYGSYYPHGGASEIAYHMIPAIERAGGKVLARAAVSCILMDENNVANGVRLSRGSGDLDIHAPIIISGAGIMNTYKKLLPEEVARKSEIYPLINNELRPGYGAMSVFISLNGTAEELGLKAQNLWAFTSSDIDGVSKSFLELPIEEALQADIPLMFVSFPSSKDPSYNDRYPGKSNCTIITLANWNWFNEWDGTKVKKRGLEYEAVKNQFRIRIVEQMLTYYPQLRDKIEMEMIGSPLTNNHYIGSYRGEIYGLDHNIARFASADIGRKLRPQTDIKGLYLTGQDIFNCGFMGAAIGGLLTASAILNRNLWKDLIELKNSIRDAESKKRD